MSDVTPDFSSLGNVVEVKRMRELEERGITRYVEGVAIIERPGLSKLGDLKSRGSKI
jgi:hypothetical protein